MTVPDIHIAVSPEAVGEVLAPPTPEEMADTLAANVGPWVSEAAAAAFRVGVRQERARAATREAALAAEVTGLRATVARFVHGHDIEGDWICPNCYEVARLRAEVEEDAGIFKVLRRRAADAEGERDHYKDREQSIVAACERVSDGGQYRADIVSAIEQIRDERNAARADLEVVRAEVERLWKERAESLGAAADAALPTLTNLARVLAPAPGETRLRAEDERDRLDLAEYRAAQRDRV